MKDLKEKLKDRKDALSIHSVKPNQVLLIEEFETSIKKKKNESAKLRKKELK